MPSKCELCKQNKNNNELQIVNIRYEKNNNIKVCNLCINDKLQKCEYQTRKEHYGFKDTDFNNRLKNSKDKKIKPTKRCISCRKYQATLTRRYLQRKNRQERGENSESENIYPDDETFSDIDEINEIEESDDEDNCIEIETDDEEESENEEEEKEQNKKRKHSKINKCDKCDVKLDKSNNSKKSNLCDKCLKKIKTPQTSFGNPTSLFSNPVQNSQTSNNCTFGNPNSLFSNPVQNPQPQTSSNSFGGFGTPFGGFVNSPFENPQTSNNQTFGTPASLFGSTQQPTNQQQVNSSLLKNIGYHIDINNIIRMINTDPKFRFELLRLLIKYDKSV